MKTASVRKNKSTLPKNIWLRCARDGEGEKRIEVFFQPERYWMLVSPGWVLQPCKYHGQGNRNTSSRHSLKDWSLPPLLPKGLRHLISKEVSDLQSLYGDFLHPRGRLPIFQRAALKHKALLNFHSQLPVCFANWLSDCLPRRLKHPWHYIRSFMHLTWHLTTLGGHTLNVRLAAAAFGLSS